MKNKASLVLMEQLVMILVVALAAAACLQVFAWSDRTSREMEQRSEAVILCQNAAETLKSCGDLSAGARLLGAARQEDTWVLQSGEIRLEIREISSGIPGLGQAELCAFDEASDEILFTLATGWQEVGE